MPDKYECLTNRICRTIGGTITAVNRRPAFVLPERNQLRRRRRLLEPSRNMLSKGTVSYESGVLRQIACVPLTRDAHRGMTRLRSYRYNYELHIPEA
jgi:hypothetical protein